MLEQLSGKPFAEADIPPDLAEKRAKQAARAAKKAEAAQNPAEKKPARTNTAALAKRLNRQLEGLDMAEQIVEDLLNAGVGSLAGTSAKTYEQLAKDCERDNYMSAQEALEYGLIDKVFEKR